MSFERNKGQADKEVKFLARGSGYSLFLTSTEAVLALSKHVHTIDKESMVEQKARLQGANRIHAAKEVAAQGLPSDVLRLTLVGANPAAEIVGSDELPGKSNYYIGNDVANWRTNVAHYTHVHYKDIYPGVELIYYGNQGQLEYDFVVAPGADPKSLILSVKGARRIHIDARGALVLETARGKIVQHKPIVYQEIKGKRKEITGRYMIKDTREVGFDIGEYDLTQTLVIDPVLSYSTYLGGSRDDVGNAIAVDSTGNAYITGQTSSINFPTLNASQPSYGSGSIDAFVTKLTATGGLSYSTYLGGSGSDEALGIAVDSAGSTYMAGLTLSTNFPTLNAFQGSNGGGFDDVFVTKLTASGALSYSTYLGGNSNEEASGIAVDAAGNAYVTGDTQSTNFPTLNAYQGSHAIDANNPDVFVTKLMSNGALGYSTYLGGDNSDVGWSIAVDATSSAYVTGDTLSTNFPTANAFQVHKNGGIDVFITKLTAGGGLSYSTYLGGNSDDIGKGIAIDSASNAYLTGLTFSTNFPTTLKPYQEAHAIDNARSDAFVTKLTASGSLGYSTYLGGNMTDSGAGIAVDPGGNAYVTGSTESTDFPPLDAFQSTHVSGFTSAFVAKLTASGGLSYSTYLGGNSNDQGLGIAVDSVGNAYVTGATRSTNFPPMKAFQANNGGGIDAFVTKLTVAASEPLIFIPGIAGSYLVDVSGTLPEQLWPPGTSRFDALINGNARLERLRLATSGSANIVATDVIRFDPLKDVYGKLLNALEGSEFGYRDYHILGPTSLTNEGCSLVQKSENPSQNPNLFVFPYDWRLGHGENVVKLWSYIQCVQKFWPNSKVNILAHSTGGLMARRLIIDHPGNVDKLITIGSPFVGAPKAIHSYFTGDFFDDGIADYLFRDTIKSLIPKFEGVAALTPSYAYYDLGGRPFAEAGVDADHNKTDQEIYDGYAQLVKMLNIQFGLDPTGTSGPGTANQLFHTPAQDNWKDNEPDPTVRYFHIVGLQGLDKTIGSVVAKKEALCFSRSFCPLSISRVVEKMTSGDGTVPLLSATRSNGGLLALNAIGAKVQIVHFVGATYDHTTMTGNTAVIALIAEDLADSKGESGASVVASRGGTVIGLQSSQTPANYLSVIGNANLTVADSFGNSAAPLDPSKFGDVVTGVDFDLLGENSLLVTMDASQTYTVTFRSAGTPVNMEFKQGTEQATLLATRFLDVVIPTGSIAMISVTPAGVTDVRYDTHGDGKFVNVVSATASASGAAAQDTDPPSIQISATGQGSNSVVNIQSSDSGSGVKATYFSLNGTIFQTYSGPFTVNQYQAPAVYAFADDNVGNRSGLITYRLINPGVPVLVTEAGSTRAIALDSVLWLREPFKSSYAFPWGSDQRTRVTLFALNFDLSPGENASSVTATAQDGSNQVYSLPVEFVGKMPGAEWLTCVVVKLNENIGDIGDVLVQISYHGINSNRVRVGIGHIGGGPPDNVISLPGSRPLP